MVVVVGMRLHNRRRWPQRAFRGSCLLQGQKLLLVSSTFWFPPDLNFLPFGFCLGFLISQERCHFCGQRQIGFGLKVFRLVKLRFSQ